MREIITYISEYADPDTAQDMLNKFLAARDSLGTLSNRGRILPELLEFNNAIYRELIISPYRMIYKQDKTTKSVLIHAVLDGRRDLTDVLRERFLRV